MTPRSWIRKLFARTPRTARKAPARCRPAVEALEDRAVPAVTFNTANLTAGSAPTSVAVGDFNGDGRQDLAVANATSSGTVSVLLGKGDGTFQLAKNSAAGSLPASVAVGDFDGDGKQDLAVANDSSGNSGTVSVLLGKGDGTFQLAKNSDAGSLPASVAVGDFNGD